MTPPRGSAKSIFSTMLRIPDVERPSAFEGPPLSELQRDESASRDEDVVAARGQLRELIAPFGVGVDASIEAQLCGRDPHLRASQRSAGVGCDDTAANARGARGSRRQRRRAAASACEALVGPVVRRLEEARRLCRGDEREEKNSDGQSTWGTRSHSTSGM